MSLDHSFPQGIPPPLATALCIILVGFIPHRAGLSSPGAERILLAGLSGGPGPDLSLQPMRELGRASGARMTLDTVRWGT